MKHLIIVAIVLFSTPAKAEWTPGTVTLNQFQYGLNSAPKEPTTAEIYAHIKSQLRALMGWSK